MTHALFQTKYSIRVHGNYTHLNYVVMHRLHQNYESKLHNNACNEPQSLFFFLHVSTALRLMQTAHGLFLAV